MDSEQVRSASDPLPSKAPDPRGRSPGRPSSFFTGLGCALPAAAAYALVCPALVWFLILIGGKADERPPAFHLVYLLAPLLLFGKALIDTLARRAKLERMSAVTSVGATLVALPLGVSSGSVCAVMTNFDRIRGPHEVPVAGSLALVSILLLFGFVALASSGPTLLRTATFSLGLAVLSSAVFGVIFALAAARAASLPGVDHYESDLRHIPFDAPGVLQNPATVGHREAGLYPTSQGYQEPPRYLPGPLGQDRSQSGGLTIVRSCAEEGCRLRISEVDPSPGEDTAQGGLLLEWGASRDLLVDEPGGAVYVRRGLGEMDRLFVRVDGTWVMRDHDARQVARRTSVPVAWLFTSGALLLVMAIQWSRRRALVGDRRRLDTARGGTLAPDGTIVFEDSPPLRLEGAVGVTGPVTVFFDSRRREGALPGLGAVPSDSVLPWEIACLRETAALRVTCHDAGILAVASLGVAPLIGAAIAGLVL